MTKSWNFMHDVVAEEELIRIPYLSKFGKNSRIYQIMKLYLFGPSSGLYACPTSMTDGAVFLIKYIEVTNSFNILENSSRITFRRHERSLYENDIK